MRIKHLKRELDKLGPEYDDFDIVMKTPNRLDSTYKLTIGNHRIFIECSDLLDNYHTMDDTPFPLPEKSFESGEALMTDSYGKIIGKNLINDREYQYYLKLKEKYNSGNLFIMKEDN